MRDAAFRSPLKARLKCLIHGHDWRPATSPRSGFYHRCRRCWIDQSYSETIEHSQAPVAENSRLAAH
jgi:hypothetical protein